MHRFIIVLFSILFVSQGVLGQGSEDLSNAQSLLTSLVLDAERNVQDWKNLWSENEPLYAFQVSSSQGDVNNKSEECHIKDSTVTQTQTDIETCEHYITWISNKIQDNIARVTDLEADRCDSTMLYINGLKHNKMALSLIQFLKITIANKDSLSLAQRKVLLERLTVFMQLYQNSKLKELIQITKQAGEGYVNDADYEVSTNASERLRTEAEIGSQHIDDNRERINLENYQSSDRQDWPSYKRQLLELLDALEQEIATKVTQSQDDEMNAGIGLADFKIQVERENKDLDKHLYLESARLGELQGKLVTVTNIATVCNGELRNLEGQLQANTDVYNQQKQNFEDKKKSYEDELETFEYVLKLYSTKMEEQTYGGREVDRFSSIIN